MTEVKMKDTGEIRILPDREARELLAGGEKAKATMVTQYFTNEEPKPKKEDHKEEPEGEEEEEQKPSDDPEPEPAAQ